MILELRDGRRMEYRAAEWGTSHLIPAPGAVDVSRAGVVIDHETAAGLPAVAAALRIPAEIIATLPLDVYDSRPGARWTWTLARNRWQNELLDQPDQTCSGFDFWQDVSSHVDGCGNAYAFKVVDSGRVVEMLLLDPERVKVERDTRTRAKRFCVWNPDEARTLELTAAQVLHIRGWDPAGGLAARSPIQRHIDSLGKNVARDRFAQRYLGNDARPDFVITMPQNVTREQAENFLDVWDARHKGPDKKGRPALLGGGADIKVVPISMRDSQYVESEQFSVSEIARIFSVPRSLLEGAGERMTVEQELARFVRVFLVPRLSRIEQALAADPMLFGVRSSFRPRFDVSELMRGDAGTMAEVLHKLIQVGAMTPNEGRAQIGLPPIDGGDQLQATPVGGAPNPGPAAPEPPEPDDDDEDRTTRIVLEQRSERVDVQPVINVHVPPAEAPQVNVAAPEVNVSVEPTPVNVAAPAVRVDAPVTVNVPKPGSKRVQVTRDPMTGLMTGAKVEED